MNEKAFVNPIMLKWARETANLTIKEVKEKLNKKKVTEEVIDNWENGKDQPSYTQFENLVDLYKRSSAIFYFPEPPEEESTEKKFRSLPQDYIRSLSHKICYIARLAQARQYELSELHSNVPPKEIQNFQKFKADLMSQKLSPSALADRIRKKLAITIEEQKNWKDDDVALKEWRAAIEKTGVWVFKRNFKDKNCSGFYLNDHNFPVIFINNNDSKNRQIFTLFHEFGHFLMSKGGISFRDNIEANFQGSYKKEEVFCNQFAASFLLPRELFNQDSSLIKNNLDEASLSLYSKKYKVSKQAILVRLLTMSLINQATYEEKNNYLKRKYEKPRSSNGGGNYYPTQKQYLGEKYINLAFSKYYANLIDEVQLADYLNNMKTKNLKKIENLIY